MSDVIAAVSTPHGRGGIAVIRISGDGATDVADAMFRRRNGTKLSEMKSRTIAYGDIVRGGERIDDGCAALFRAPGSYTGEDTVEISCHGGVLVTRMVYETALMCGARAAEPGEFTRRAFVNGRIGLTEAEAVMDLIDARSEDAARLAAGNSASALGREIAAIREKLIALISAAYVRIDYPDEDLSGMDEGSALDGVRKIIEDIDALLVTYRAGHAVAHGVSTVICGTPNTGKSSLLNALLGRDRAIVTPMEGTTRDTIEEQCRAGGILLDLCDTAGVRESADEAERLGIERTKKQIESSELVLAVIDGSREQKSGDLELLSELDPEKTVLIINKSDLGRAALPKETDRFENRAVVSCLTGEGIGELKEQISALFGDGDVDFTRAVVTSARQHAALTRAREYAASAAGSLEQGATADVAGLDLELAAGALGEADGASVSVDVVNGIFSRFCVGK